MPNLLETTVTKLVLGLVSDRQHPAKASPGPPCVFRQVSLANRAFRLKWDNLEIERTEWQV